MEAHNFLRQAIKGVGDFIEFSQKLKAPMTQDYCVMSMQLLREMQKSVKFIMPEGGRLFDTNLEALSEESKLPFEQIIIEYECKSNGGLPEKVFGQESTKNARKRIVYAQQETDGTISVFSIVAFQSDSGRDVWVMQPFIAQLIPSGMVKNIEMKTPDNLPKNMNLLNQFRIYFCDIGGQAHLSFGDKWEEHAYYDMNDEANAVLNLMEALSCKNVNTEVLAVKKNKFQQRKHGALPYDEYRVLVVSNRNSNRAESGEGTHRSPREHLRRGHIRRLPIGNVWVNATVVNPGNHGKINKIYAIA